jgi:hypothetical protein
VLEQNGFEQKFRRRLFYLQAHVPYFLPTMSQIQDTKQSKAKQCNVQSLTFILYSKDYVCTYVRIP